jgi:hypothetical protein
MGAMTDLDQLAVAAREVRPLNYEPRRRAGSAAGKAFRFGFFAGLGFVAAELLLSLVVVILFLLGSLPFNIRVAL